MNNTFLQANLGTIEKLKKQLLELEMMGSYQEVPLPLIRHLFSGLVLEISKLQGENDEIKKLIPKKGEVNEERPLPNKQKGRR
jgi:hypothetical protein